MLSFLLFGHPLQDPCVRPVAVGDLERDEHAPLEGACAEDGSAAEEGERKAHAHEAEACVEVRAAPSKPYCS